LSEEQRAKYSNYLKKLTEAKANMTEEQKAKYVRLRKYWLKKRAG
jgi:hypothetical protein